MGLVYHLSYFIIVDKFWKKIKENDERWNEFEFDGGGGGDDDGVFWGECEA